MLVRIKKLESISSIIVIAALCFLLQSCDSENNGIAEYAGSPKMSGIKVEDGSFKPKITWVGGYVSVIGVNIGSQAKLDSSLVFLVKSDGNVIKYPVTFGVTPDGTTSIISNYGAAAHDRLKEDNVYTYWVMKAELWDKIAGLKGKSIVANDQLAEGVYQSVGDSLLELSQYSFNEQEQQLDVFVNIADVTAFGKLAIIDIAQPTDTLGPKISWTIIQEDVTDNKISAMGLVEGSQFTATKQIWDLWSVQTAGDESVYGKNNVISPPVHLGILPDSTRTFYQLPDERLERGKDYYLWIANETWDGKSRMRVTKYYAYATFRTW